MTMKKKKSNAENATNKERVLKDTNEKQIMNSNGEIILYQPDENVKIEVRIIDNTVWLNRKQLSLLFDRDIKTIGKHINNALEEELKDMATVANFAIVQSEGNRLVNRTIEYYNLDMVLSVGYRVKSNRGVKYRKWANRVLKEYLLRGYSVNNRLEHLEQRVSRTEEKIDFFVRTSLPPQQGIFFDGQVFDAYKFVCDLVRKAQRSIVLIDNYVDETVLTLLDKRSDGVSATIYTKLMDDKLSLDLKRHNEQYRSIEVIQFNKAHDRFFLIDDEVYQIGASIKDLGKKWFAFTLLRDSTALELINRIK